MSWLFDHTQQASVLATSHTDKYWLVLDTRITTLPDEMWAAITTADGTDIHVWNESRTVEYPRYCVNLNTGTKNIQLWAVLGSLSDVVDVKYVIEVGGEVVAFTASPYAGHWPLEGVSDISANENNLTNVDSTPFEAAEIENGAHFDGTNDYLWSNDVSHYASLTTGHVSFCFNFDVDNDSIPVIFGVDRDADATLTYMNFGLRFKNTGAPRDDTFQLLLNVDGVTKWHYTFGSNWTDGKAGNWYRVVVVQNGTAPVAYVNGSLIALSSVNTNDTTKWFKAVITDAVSKSDSLEIGAQKTNGGFNRPFDGLVDDCHISDDIWSANEVADHDANISDPDSFWVSSNWRASSSLKYPVFQRYGQKVMQTYFN